MSETIAAMDLGAIKDILGTLAVISLISEAYGMLMRVSARCWLGRVVLGLADDSLYAAKRAGRDRGRFATTAAGEAPTGAPWPSLTATGTKAA